MEGQELRHRRRAGRRHVVAIDDFEDVATIELALGDFSIRVIAIDAVIAPTRWSSPSERGSSCCRSPHAMATGPRFPMHHRDPFDRLLVAQAAVEGFALLTADAELGA